MYFISQKIKLIGFCFFIILILIVFKSKSLLINDFICKSENKMVSNTQLEIFQKNFNDNINQQNRLGDNFVRDFLRYECKNMKRYGGGLGDIKYRRQDGNLFIFKLNLPFNYRELFWQIEFLY